MLTVPARHSALSAWLPLIEAYYASKLPQSEFCSRHKIPKSTFYTKVKRYESSVLGSKQSSSFVPLEVSSGDVVMKCVPCKVLLSSGCQLVFESGIGVSELISLLKGTGQC